MPDRATHSHRLLLNARQMSLPSAYHQPSMAFSPDAEHLACRPGKALRACVRVRAHSSTQGLSDHPKATLKLNAGRCLLVRLLPCLACLAPVHQQVSSGADLAWHAGFHGAAFVLIETQTGHVREIDNLGGDASVHLTWAPDSRALAIQTKRGWTVLAASGEELASVSTALDLSLPLTISWRPDSRAFCGLPTHRGPQAGIFALDIGSRKTQRHQPSDSEYLDVAWLPCKLQGHLWLAVMYRWLHTQRESEVGLIALQAAGHVGSVLPSKYAQELEPGFPDHFAAGARHVVVSWSSHGSAVQKLLVFAVSVTGSQPTLLLSHVIPLHVPPLSLLLSPDSNFLALDAPLGLRTSQGVLCGVNAVHLGPGKLIALPLFFMFRDSKRPCSYPLAELRAWSRDGSRLAVTLTCEAIEDCWQQVYSFS